jgi:prepilin-type N-terminal cleavage/methylation domain-containing protein
MPVGEVLSRVRQQHGFGMVELLAAMTVMLVGLLAVFGVFNAGILQIRRASTTTTAAAIADAEMERFRAIKYESIGLAATDLAAVDTVYAADSAYRADTGPSTSLSASIDSDDLAIPVSGASGFPAKAPFVVKIDDELVLVNNRTNATSWLVRAVEERGFTNTVPASHSAGSTVTQKQRVEIAKCGSPPVQPCTDKLPTQNAVTGADGKGYRVDTYVTWLTIFNSSGEAAGRVLKLVTVVVRDSSAPHREWARLSSSFDESTGL